MIRLAATPATATIRSGVPLPKAEDRDRQQQHAPDDLNGCEKCKRPLDIRKAPSLANQRLRRKPQVGVGQPTFRSSGPSAGAMDGGFVHCAIANSAETDLFLRDRQFLGLDNGAAGWVRARWFRWRVPPASWPIRAERPASRRMDGMTPPEGRSCQGRVDGGFWLRTGASAT